MIGMVLTIQKILNNIKPTLSGFFYCEFFTWLTNHENSKVSGIAKAILNAENKNFEFGSVNDGKVSKIGKLVKNNIDREFPDGSIEMFVNAFAALNDDGSSTIKIK